MRANLDIETIKRRTVQGYDNFLEKKRQINAEERVRVPDSALEQSTNFEEKPKTRTQLHRQRKHSTHTYNKQTFNNFKIGIHGGKTIPNFYQAPKLAENSEEFTI